MNSSNIIKNIKHKVSSISYKWFDHAKWTITKYIHKNDYKKRKELKMGDFIFIIVITISIKNKNSHYNASEPEAKRRVSIQKWRAGHLWVPSAGSVPFRWPAGCVWWRVPRYHGCPWQFDEVLHSTTIITSKPIYYFSFIVSSHGIVPTRSRPHLIQPNSS